MVKCYLKLEKLIRLIKKKDRSKEKQINHGNKKAGGSSRNGRDSAGRRLGVKNMVVNMFYQAI